MSHERVLLFTDAVDSTQLTERLGDEAASSLWAEHDRIVRRLMREGGGREIDKSDGFLLLFDDVPAAVTCGLRLHRELAQLSPPLASRAGIHRAQMLTRENSADDQASGAKPLEVDGIGKAVASRVMTLARGGQTLLSADAFGALHGGTSEQGWQVTSHGHWRMKGLAEPIELFEVAAAGTPMLPPLDSPKAYRVVRTDDRWTPRAELRHGLPAERDAFVGRGDMLTALAARFDAGDPVRLVSLLGIGGIGKTRLALRYARDWLGDYPGGAWFCDLSSARSLDGIVHAVAQGLDVPLGKTSPVQQLGAAITGRGRCLVILDNFEQVTRHAEATVGQWLERAPEARFIVTSREVLGVPGEEAFVLAPMVQHDAVRLFESRADAITGQPGLDDVQRSALPRLVELLDFLPLAIELAAARTRVMSVQAILERMGARFKLLATSGGRRDRQATLRAALDWSWDLLSVAEQSALAQLSVFEGGFIRDAAEAVLDTGKHPEAPWVDDLLQGLIEKSLLSRSAASRFSFLRTVLDYLIDKCHASAQKGTVEGAVSRHARYYALLDEQAATSGRCADIDNLMLACRRSLPANVGIAVRALVNLWAALRMTGPLSAIIPALAAIEETPGLELPERARLEWVAAGMLHQAGDLAQALARAEAALRFGAASTEARTLAALELTLADVLRTLGRLRESAEHAERAMSHAQRSGEPLSRLEVLNSLGALHFAKGEQGDARRYYLEALELARASSQERWMGGLLGNLAVIDRREGHLQQALCHFEEALALAERIGDRQWEGNNRSNLALLRQDMGDAQGAAEQLHRALHIAREIGHVRLERFALCNLGIVLEVLGRNPEALSCFELAVAMSASNADHHSESSFRGYLALHLGRGGTHDRAETELQQALVQMRGMDSPSALGLLLAQGAVVAALAGHLALSRQRADEAHGILEGAAAASIETGRLFEQAREAGLRG